MGINISISAITLTITKQHKDRSSQVAGLGQSGGIRREIADSRNKATNNSIKMASVVARRVVGELSKARTRTGNLSVRNMSGGGTYEEEVATMKTWKNVTVIAGLPILAWSGYTLFGGGHHEAHEQKPYSYLHVRTREYPWGNCNLFEKWAGRCQE